jgi:hypothetical protein
MLLAQVGGWFNYCVGRLQSQLIFARKIIMLIVTNMDEM